MKSLYVILALLFSPVLGFVGSKTFLLPRSKGADLMLEMAGARELINRPDSQSNYVHLSGAALYDQLFHTSDVARYFFGTTKLVFTGSLVPDRNPNDMLADYFGMSTTAETALCFNPHMSNFTTDFYWYTSLDQLCHGLYISARFPIERAVWDINPNEIVTTSGQPDVAGYMGPLAIPVGDTEGMLGTRVSDYLKGKRYSGVGDVTPFIFGDFHEPLAYGKIIGRQTMTRVADIVLTLGYNAIQKDRLDGAFFIRGLIHTGNSSKAEFLFEPTIGNGGHWELGGGYNLRFDAWSSDDASRSLAFCFDGFISHLFASDQMRSFDFKNHGKGSRYMLMTQLGSPSQNLFLGSDTGAAAPYQYEGRILPAINETTLHIKTDFAVQADLLFSALYDYNATSLEVGYNLFVRSEERGHCREKFPSNLFALKGDAQVYGFDAANNPVKLSVTQSKATIHAGQGVTNFVPGADYQNLNADNPVIAADSVVNLNQLNASDSALTGIAPLVVRTSGVPIFLSDADLNVQSGLLPQLITHRLFINLSYRWESDELDMVPFVGLIGYAEWAREHHEVGTPCMWAVAVKGGLSF
jgi:hypothetical protein